MPQPRLAPGLFHDRGEVVPVQPPVPVPTLPPRGNVSAATLPPTGNVAAAVQAPLPGTTAAPCRARLPGASCTPPNNSLLLQVQAAHPVPQDQGDNNGSKEDSST